MPGVVLAVPATITNLIQQGFLQRAFHDGLFPQLMYRDEAVWEEWGDHQGVEVYITRPGLLTPVEEPLVAGVDPTPQNPTYEQFLITLSRYGDTIDVHTPTSVVSSGNQFLQRINQLGLQAGMSLNRIPRNALFSRYCGGHTVLIAAAAAGDTTIRVASLQNFTEVLSLTVTARPSPVSAATPLPVTIGGGIGVRNVIGQTPDDANDPNGPGTLQLSAAIGGAGVAARVSVISSQRPNIIRSGGGVSVDAIGAGDIITLQDLINATNKLRKNNVPPHADGFYHAHLNTDANSQLFADAAFQRVNMGQVDGMRYKEALVGVIAGCACFVNTESPDLNNCGTRTATGTNAFYSKSIHAETTNEGGINIGRVIVTGKGALIEKGLDESDYVTEAGVTGKVGEFQVTNAGMAINTERVRLILRAPLNRMQDKVAATWSISTGFGVPSDVGTGDVALFKRAMVIEHAID